MAGVIVSMTDSSPHVPVGSGVPVLPPSTRLQFPSGAMIVVDAENHPCRYPADIISKHHPEQKKGFVAAAMHKRGVVGWVEAEGIIRAGFQPHRLLAPLCLNDNAAGGAAGAGLRARAAFDEKEHA